MYSKVSKAKRCNRTKTKAVVVARILQKTASIPSQDTTHVPPQDTVPVSPQDPIPTIPQDPIPVTPQDAVPIPPQGAVPILLQDTVPVPPQDTVPVTPQVAIPRIPNDIIIEILDHLASASDVRSLRACALLSTLWAQPCRRHLFRAIRFTAATKPPQDIIPTPPRDTIPIPPQDTFPVLPQDIVLIIPQDTTPTIPHDIIDEILGHLARGSNFRSLRTCALVSGAWVKACQRHLFRTVHFTATNARKWFETFPVQEDSPAHLVRDLRIEIKQPASIPGKLFECISWFTNVERISLLGPWGYPLGGRFPPLCEPSFWKLPRSVTSLTVTIAITLVQVRDIVAQLPNLDDLVLTKFAEEDRTKLPVTGTGLKGTFGGRLILCGPCVREGIINMLLETPSGLHFAELEIYCTRNCLPSSAVRLAEACGKTLVKLSHTVRLHSNSLGRPDTFERSFDFSKFPNIQDVTFGVRAYWSGQGLPWIPMALSTLRPATSPRLSIIRLSLFATTSRADVEIVITKIANDLRRIADEVSRIEREFEGAVNFTVIADSKFYAALGSLNILQRHIN